MADGAAIRSVEERRRVQRTQQAMCQQDVCLDLLLELRSVHHGFRSDKTQTLRVLRRSSRRNSKRRRPHDSNSIGAELPA
jgi:hypothetical protein